MNTNQKWDVGLSEKRYPTSQSTGYMCFKQKAGLLSKYFLDLLFHLYDKGGVGNYRFLRIYRKDKKSVKPLLQVRQCLGL